MRGVWEDETHAANRTVIVCSTYITVLSIIIFYLAATGVKADMFVLHSMANCI